MIHEWAKVSADELDTVVASNFMRIFVLKRKANRNMKSLPQSVKKNLLRKYPQKCRNWRK